ncbi:cilia- and flagella-associated protein 100 [Podargus strigoides]
MSVLFNNHSALSQETHSPEAITGSEMSSPHTESVSKSLSVKPGVKSRLVLSESPDKDEENPMRNPFRLPSDIDILSIRDKERKKAEAEREMKKTMKIHEKMTYSTKMKAKQKGCRKALQKEEEEEAREREEILKILQKSRLWKTIMKKEKETFLDRIYDRREMLSVKYAVAVKQDEIQRLEKVAKNEERKLKEAEHHLKNDVSKFDEFLKENQESSVQALKIAQKETTAKMKKIQEVQSITFQIEKFRSEISKLTHTLQEYRMYRDLLYQLSPKEWQEEHRKKHTKEKDLKRAFQANEKHTSPPTTAEQGECQGRAAHSSLGQPLALSVHLCLSPGEDLTARMDTASPYSTSFDIDVPSSLLSSKTLELNSLHEIMPQLKNFPNPPSTRKLISLEDTESETCSDDDEEPELYFTDPQQLLSAFMEMEEENLSFLQNSQETEESLDKVKHTITTHESIEEKLAELKQQVATLKSSITKEKERLADLKLKVQLLPSGEYKPDEEQDKILTSLNKKVMEVYYHCTGEHETNLQTVQMLMVIEKHLTDLLNRLKSLIPPKTEQTEKAKKQRARSKDATGHLIVSVRPQVNQIQQIKKKVSYHLHSNKLQHWLHPDSCDPVVLHWSYRKSSWKRRQQKEERLKQTLERSQRTIKKESSKRPVFHSKPPARKQKKKQTQEQTDNENKEQLLFRLTAQLYPQT